MDNKATERGRKSALERAEVMMAFANGEKIKIRAKHTEKEEDWQECPHPVWNWPHFEYAVDREPRRFWVNVYPDGSAGGPYASREGARVIARSWYASVETIEVVEVMS